MAWDIDTAFARLERAVARGRLPHACLISGPEGSGKRALATRLAALFTGSDHGLAHPDIHVVEPESKSRQIRIEQTRKIERELQMRPVQGERKAAVIFDAERMNASAANSFLKTLEEPPGHCLLLLVSAQPAQLPETIRSRCIPVELRAPQRRALAPGPARFLAALRDHCQTTEHGVTPALRLAWLFSALLAEAREQIAAELEATHKAEEKHYRDTTDSRGWLAEREQYFSALTSARYLAVRDGFARVLLEWWTDVARQQHGAACLDLPEYAATTGALAARLTLAEVLQKIEACEEMREHFERSVHEQTAIEVAFLKMFA